MNFLRSIYDSCEGSSKYSSYIKTKAARNIFYRDRLNRWRFSAATGWDTFLTHLRLKAFTRGPHCRRVPTDIRVSDRYSILSVLTLKWAKTLSHIFKSSSFFRNLTQDLGRKVSWADRQKSRRGYDHRTLVSMCSSSVTSDFYFTRTSFSSVTRRACRYALPFRSHGKVSSNLRDASFKFSLKLDMNLVWNQVCRTMGCVTLTLAWVNIEQVGYNVMRIDKFWRVRFTLSGSADETLKLEISISINVVTFFVSK